MSGLPLVPVNDLRRSWLASSDAGIEVVERVLRSGRFLNGLELAGLEAELGAYLGAGHAVGVASGTDALIVALRALGRVAGDEIVTAANAGGYASIAAAAIGCRVVYADVDPRTLVMTASSVAEVLGPQTRTVIVTHLYGNIADTPAIRDLCRPLGISVVEDFAQALGAQVDGAHVPVTGDLAAISFYPTKNLGAAGDAGAVVTDDARLASAARSLREYGWSTKYRIDRPGGLNSRMDEIQAAIVRHALPAVDDDAARRRDIVERYRQSLAGSPLRLVTGATPAFSAHLAVIRCSNRARVETVLRAAMIGFDVHYPIPDHRQKGLPTPARATHLPVTERAVDEVLTMPCFPQLTDAEVSRVAAALGGIAGA